MNPTRNAPTDRVSARRRLLRGSFAAPAVLTMYSGSALANASSKRCLTYATGTVVTQPPCTDVSDGWYRVQLRKEQSTNVYWLLGSDIGPVSKRTFLLGDNYAQKFGVDSTNSTQYNKLYGTAVTTGCGSTTNHSNTPKKFCALRVDANGMCTGVGSWGSGSAIPQSCWNSFKLGGG